MSSKSSVLLWGIGRSFIISAHLKACFQQLQSGADVSEVSAGKAAVGEAMTGGKNVCSISDRDRQGGQRGQRHKPCPSAAALTTQRLNGSFDVLKDSLSSRAAVGFHCCVRVDAVS